MSLEVIGNVIKIIVLIFSPKQDYLQKITELEVCTEMFQLRIKNK